MLSGLQIASPEFAMNGSISANYTCDGSNVNPPLVISSVPQAAHSLVLIGDDPDNRWDHGFIAVVSNIPAINGVIAENHVPVTATAMLVVGLKIDAEAEALGHDPSPVQAGRIGIGPGRGGDHTGSGQVVHWE